MKKIFQISALLVAAMLVTACHSSEQNYRAAYEKAMERRKTGIGAETYAKIEAERQQYTTVINGDSVRLLYLNANVAIDTTRAAATYNVVVATFTQRINAKSYRDRLREECGFKDSYVLYGGPDKQYFVVLQGFEDPTPAAALIRDLNKKVCIKILEPLPWILRKI